MDPTSSLLLSAGPGGISAAGQLQESAVVRCLLLRDELMAAGANRVVVLPTRPESLRDMIRAVLNQPAHADS